MSDTAVRELHVSRQARDRYQLDDALFGVSGRVVFADFHAARVLAQKINQTRDLVRNPEQAVSAASLNAIGLMHEMLHLVVEDLRARDPGLLGRALVSLEESIGRGAVDGLLRVFVDHFPPVDVYRRRQTPEEYLDGSSAGVPHREMALEELLLLWASNLNPALRPYRELFDDEPLRTGTPYLEAVGSLQGHFAEAVGRGGGAHGLLDLLRAPALASPGSIEGQLEFIRRTWSHLLGATVHRLLGGLDFLAEESKPFFGFGPGPVEVPTFAGLEEEAESYSTDLDWMPRVVLMAKNAYVWLDQLSRRYGRPVTRLDQVPDSELDTLAAWGVTGLWLIGVWERSRASARIKQLMGDTDASASAYALYDYTVAADLGGDEAFDELKNRAGARGIRMSTDMVPNHVGVDSRWVVEHPDWFVGLDHSPFPAYTFDGPDLSDDPRVGIFIEDHYYSRSDAAVVFKRLDRWTGSVRYLYHGNDGTSMPWNDTAQLDYRSPEVREAVIQTILHVARRSPIIRFDAAMTLTKKNFHRLWFPEPGSGGDIPSRAGHGMTRAELDAVMPEEFWREVVDRVAAEVPDTLLLAEAFWLLEGYFVRTLGMHRVYNSAFMNMLRDERNAEYRQLITSTLEFDPQILKRYVNFMSNPDERTAVDQFGTGDKYFGVATLMATMPGLPMLAHGQVEGFTEKYGMEFRRARLQEDPDPWLGERHRRQVFPLLRRRQLFAEVDQFRLYDFLRPDGTVDENVFAYSNAGRGQRSLVLYHNRYAETHGSIKQSTPVVVRDPGGERRLETFSLAQALGTADDGERFVLMRDAVTGLEHIRSCRELNDRGLYVELGAYGLHVFVDLREVADDASGRYRRLNELLAGCGVPSLEEADRELLLEPLLGPFRQLVSTDGLARVLDARPAGAGKGAGADLLGLVRDPLVELLTAAAGQAGVPAEVAPVVDRVTATLAEVLRLPVLASAVEEGPAARAASLAASRLDDDPLAWGPLLAFAVTHALGDLVGDDDPVGRTRSLLDEWLLGSALARALREGGAESGAARRATAGLRLLVANQGWHAADGEPAARARRLLGRLAVDPEVQAFLGVNRFRDQLWFNRECYDELLLWLVRLAAVEITRDFREEVTERLTVVWSVVEELRAREAASGYRLERLVATPAGTVDNDGTGPEMAGPEGTGGDVAADDDQPDEGGETCDE